MRSILLASCAACVPMVFMSADACDTVQIETDNGPVTINAADYDEKVHKLVKSPKDADAPEPASGAVVIPPDNLIVPPAPSAPNQASAVPPATVSADAWLVMLVGKKYFVVDVQGNKITDSPVINKDGYPTEDAAKAAIANRPFAQTAFVPVAPAPEA